MKDVRNGFLVFVTEYRNNATDIGSRNHQFRGAKAPDSKAPLKMARTKLTNLAPPSFCRLFKARTKKKFVEYLSEVRISNACRYLMESDRSISEVAYVCGYKTVSNFNKLFKKITGLTPQAYKKNTIG